MQDKSIILGVSGGIAAYKAAILASTLTKMGARVHTVMTRAATEFITPLTLQSLTKEQVYVDAFDERDPSRIMHIALADAADAVIVAPATADLIARAAHGLGDDLLTTILLAVRCPVIIAPSMNVHMYANPIVQSNLNVLRTIGYHVAEPGEGLLACGYDGKGRLMEPEDIIEFAQMVLSDKPLLGKSVLVTAGPTRERIDPVRYLTNDSTGKMGYELARMARRMGADVTLVSGKVALRAPQGVLRIETDSASQMHDEVIRRATTSDVIVMAAAVADYRPATTESHKMKKDAAAMELPLVRNPDILLSLQEHAKRGAFIVGFAAETHDADYFARQKLRAKNVDMLAMNNVLEDGSGFGSETNRVVLYFRDGGVEPLPLAPKLEVAKEILTRVVARMQTGAAAESRPREELRS